MAVVSALPVLRQQIEGDLPHPHDFDRGRSMMESTREIEEDSSLSATPLPITPSPDQRIYVAVGKEKKDSKATLMYALKNAGGKKIGILHVHQPAHTIPMLGGKFPVEKLTPAQVWAYRKEEREKMDKILDEYVVICARERVSAEKFVIEMDDIEKGIIELVTQHGISMLVMGAAADKHFSRRMTAPKSRKAIAVSRQAHFSCQIWFVCKGILVCIREPSLDGTNVWVTPTSPASSSNTNASPQPIQLKSASTRTEPGTIGSSHSPDQDLLSRSKSDNFATRSGARRPTMSLDETRGTALASSSQLGLDGHVNGWEEIPTTNLMIGSTCSTGEHGIGTSNLRDNVSEDGTVLTPVHEFDEDVDRPSSMNEQVGERVDDHVYDQLEQAMAEAGNSKREAFEESIKRRKAEKDAVEAIRKAKASENSYAREMKQRKDLEELLAREMQKLENIKIQRQQVREELQKANEQRVTLESQVADSNCIAEELRQRLISAEQLLSDLQREREELQKERDKAVREAEVLRKGYEEAATSSHRAQNLSLFCFSELKEATQNFSESLQIGKGGYGSVYTGLLRHTRVAIKMLHSRSTQGRAEFQQEVEVLSKLRHPNLVTLIGTCPDTCSLVYEYLPNGSLEDRLACKGGTPPLSWQTRTRIASEICSALIFLHSNKPHSIVHGDLKPANILLDANLVSKLGDFGICRLILQQNSMTTVGWQTDPKGTFPYIDPEFLVTGVLTPRSDVYSFGIIILQLLTGKPAFGIVNEVQEALDEGNLHCILDESAGTWPFVQAKQFAHLGLRCCHMNRKSRPNLVSEVLRVLDPMRASPGSASSFHLEAEGPSRIPTYLICPIFQEIMCDPHVAADGFTYEAEAIKGWLDSGHDSSPVTNHKLEHQELIPNQAIRSAIQEWLNKP